MKTPVDALDAGALEVAAKLPINRVSYELAIDQTLTLMDYCAPGSDELAKRLLRAFRAFLPYLAAARRDGWMPIESAPLDRPVLVGWCRGNWDAAKAHCEFGKWGELTHTMGFHIYQEQPTHWRPLPAPPPPGSDET